MGRLNLDKEKFSGRGKQWLPDVRLALQNLGARKLRSLLTMLGIIFGVAAVVSMLSIGAGAQQQVLAFIEQLGVHNLIIEAKEVTDVAELRRIRKTSPGLSFKDLRVIRANGGLLLQATSFPSHGRTIPAYMELRRSTTASSDCGSSRGVFSTKTIMITGLQYVFSAKALKQTSFRRNRRGENI
jgi:ABC-type antimicrobial peptide transport system permease subunit